MRGEQRKRMLAILLFSFFLFVGNCEEKKASKETAEASEFVLTLLELVEEDGLVVDQDMVEC